MMSMRQMNQAQAAIAKSLERLATGKRINRGSDDPAGLIAATNLAVQRKAISSDIENNERQLKLFAAADGAESVVSDMFSDLNALVVQAANRGGMSVDERKALQTQADSIFAALDDLTANSKSDSNRLLAGYSRKDVMQSITDPQHASDGPIPLPNGRIAIDFDAMRTGGFDLVNGDLESLQSMVKSWSDYNANRRGLLGTSMQSNEARLRSLHAELIATAGSQSQIEDTDMAKEISELIRNQTLAQAATYSSMSSLSQARQTTLALLQ